MDEICQCCGMILKTSDDMGCFTDGTVNSDYCRFCFSDGGFTHATMDEQIQCNLQHLEEWRLEKDVDISRGEAEIQLREYLPRLKRWLPMEKNILDTGEMRIRCPVNESHGISKTDRSGCPVIGRYPQTVDDRRLQFREGLRSPCRRQSGSMHSQKRRQYHTHRPCVCSR